MIRIWSLHNIPRLNKDVLSLLWCYRRAGQLSCLISSASQAAEAKLEAALEALQDVNENNDASAINKLGAFLNEVEAQRGKKLTDEQADTLLAAAQAIIDLLTP